MACLDQRDDGCVWWTREKEEEPPLDRETVDGIISLLMRIDARLERMDPHEEDDDEDDT